MDKTFKSTVFFNDPEKSELCFQAMQFGLIWAGSLAATTKIPKYIKSIDEYETIIYVGALYAGGVLGMAKIFKNISIKL